MYPPRESCAEALAANVSSRKIRTTYVIIASAFKFEQPLCIGLVKHTPLLLADGELVGHLHLLRHELVGIVHRVEHALEAEHLLAELDRRRPLHAARRHPDVLAQVLAGLFAQRLRAGIALGDDHRAMHEVEAKEPERKPLAQGADPAFPLRQ